MSGMEDILKNIERIMRLSIPYWVFVIMISFETISLPLLNAYDIKPQFVLMGVYYWSIYRPSLLPPYVCFFIGLVLDILLGGLLGMSALIFILMQWLVRDQRRYLMGQPYWMIWLVFTVVLFASLFAKWLVFGFVHQSYDLSLSLAGSFISSIFIFPFVSLCLLAVHKLLPETSRKYV